MNRPERQRVRRVVHQRNLYPDRPSANRPEQAERKVSWLELFFDLVLVFAITEVAALLHADHSWQGVGMAFVVFAPIYWAWVGTSVHANTHTVENPLKQIAVLAIGLCSLFMALATPGAYDDDRGLFFGLSYFVARCVLLVLVLHGRRIAYAPYVVPVLVSGPLLVLGGILGGSAQVAVWALAVAVDLATPALVRRRLTSVQFDPSHLPERFGLFLIIALGESIIVIGETSASSAHLDADVILAVATGFVLTCALWWMYFVFAATTVQAALAAARVQSTIIREVLAYGHLVLIAGITATSVGVGEVVAHPGEHPSTSVLGLMFGGCALYLATFGYIQWRMLGAWSSTRWGGAAIVLALLPAATLLPALAALGLLAAVCVSLNVVENALVKGRGKHSRVNPSGVSAAT
jgi:low temperature requirement protein LtrA